jgi:PadR family transcriptional regulator, regulatory protein PadR
MKPNNTVKGQLDALILATLQRAPAHGYAIGLALKQRSDGAFDLPEGTIYPALHRLERDGLLASEWSVQDGRRRRTYRLTSAGTKALGARRREWRAFCGAVGAVLG